MQYNTIPMPSPSPSPAAKKLKITAEQGPAPHQSEHEAELLKLRQELEAMQAERQTFQDKLEAEQAERQAFQDKLEAEQTERRALEDKLEAERQAFQDKLEAEQAERRALEDKLEAEQTERRALEAKWEAKYQALVDSMKDECKKLESKCQSLESKCQMLEGLMKAKCKTFEDGQEAARQRFEAEMEDQRQRFEAANEDQRQRFEAKIESDRQAFKAEQEAERKVFKAMMEALSLLSVLPKSDSPIPNLIARGSSSYHSHPKNEKAISSEGTFNIIDIYILNERLQLELGSSPSCLRTLIKSTRGSLTYGNEYDVQAVIQNALQDAVNICNIIISKIVHDPNHPNLPILAVRRESTIFSNIVDHAVVFDALSGTPVFVVEVKKNWGEGKNPTANVYGQVFDQLSDMYARGHPNPFGALTCFDKTYITWLDNDASNHVIGDLKEIEETNQRLEKIIRTFVVARDDTSSPQMTILPSDGIQTQSPVKEIVVVSDAESDDKNNHVVGTFVPYDKFRVLRSTSLKPQYIVAGFVSAILCSLNGFQKPRGIQKLTLEQDIQVNTLCMDSGSYSWGTLYTTCQGPKKLEGNETPPESLYLMDYLGTGITSKVYRAITLDGYDCVVKMYIKRQGDDKKILTDTEFEAFAKAAITKEYEAYQKIYGGELKGYVWMQQLNGLYCLIHPYFQHVEKNQRAMLLSSIIPERLRLFQIGNGDLGKFYSFHKSDQLWRHIGWFNGKLYMFDLGNLEEHQLNESDDFIRLHCETLRARIAES